MSILNAKIYARKFACLIIFRKMNLILNNPQLLNLMHNLNNYSSKSQTCNFRNCWKYLVIFLKNICRMSQDQNTSFMVFSYEPTRISSQLHLWYGWIFLWYSKLKFLLSYCCLKHHQSIMDHCNIFVCDYNVIKLLNFSFGYKHALNQLQCINLTF